MITTRSLFVALMMALSLSNAQASEQATVCLVENDAPMIDDILGISAGSRTTYRRGSIICTRIFYPATRAGAYHHTVCSHGLPQDTWNEMCRRWFEQEAEKYTSKK